MGTSTAQFYKIYSNHKFKIKSSLQVVQGDQKSLCTWRLYCNDQVHRDFLITLHVKQLLSGAAISPSCDIREKRRY